MTNRLTDRLTTAVYTLGWGGVKRLPEPAATGLGRRIADRTWKRRGPGVLRLEANLARVVPDADPDRLAELSRAGMRSYLRYWMESFRLPVWSEQRIRDGVEITDVHHLTDGIASDRGVILALPHMANYDLAGAWVTTALQTPFTTVVERLRPERVFDRFVAHREALGMEVLPHTGGAAFGLLARRLRAGGLVALVADRDLSASGVEVDFFGERARMPIGPATLALRTGSLLLPVHLWFDDTPVLRGRVLPPVREPAEGDRTERARRMTQEMADAFAVGIAEHPQDWHMLQRLWLADLEPTGPDGGSGGGSGSGPEGAGRTPGGVAPVRPPAARDGALGDDSRGAGSTADDGVGRTAGDPGRGEGA